ncbi:MAG: CSLREA domain-containing protein, partial [Chloroflexota bacterium]
MGSSTRVSKVRLVSVFILISMLALSILPQHRASAAGIVVNSIADDDDANIPDGICATSNGDCTLRAAIQTANINAGTDTITFDSGVFSSPQTITITSDMIHIADHTTITGPGTNYLTISGADNFQPFYALYGVNLASSDLTITQGLAIFAGGGAIY